MTQALFAIALASWLAVLWATGKPRRRILRSTDTSKVAELNKRQIELTINEKPKGSRVDPQQTYTGMPNPRCLGERLAFKRRLERMFASPGESRRESMQLCVQWGSKETIALLQRGMRDSDRKVVELAAKGMEKFRGNRTHAKHVTLKKAAHKKVPR